MVRTRSRIADPESACAPCSRRMRTTEPLPQRLDVPLRRSPRNRNPAWLPLLVLLSCAPVLAVAGNARIGVTGGASSFEGTSGGGLVPWATLGGYAGEGEAGGSVFLTRARVDDLDLTVAGLALAWEDRVELSFARQELEVRPLDTEIHQDLVGLKVRLAGRLPYTRLPQISAGVQYRRNRDFDGIPAALGARREDGVDYYLAASRLFFAALAGRNVFTNLVLRSTRAHETGLMGFGSERELLLEGSVALFATDDLAIGAEYRQKPAGLAGVDESDWSSLFVAWFPVRHLSITLARLDLGDVVRFEDQKGWYLSLEASL